MHLIIQIIPPFRTGYLFPGFPLANFDGVHYVEIAQHGYINNMRFMPLYPLLIHITNIVLPFISTQWIGFLLSLFFFIISLIYLNKLFRLDYSKKQAQEALLFLIIFPTSFFFWSVYSESLFLLLTVMSFYHARKGKWTYAGLFGFLSSLTRIVGFLTVIPLLIEYFSSHKTKKVCNFIPILFIPFGTLLYAIYNYIRWGNPLLFIQAHSQLSNGRSSTALILFPQTLYRYFKILTTVSVSLWEWKIALLELVFFCIGALGIYILWKQKVRLSYLVYTALSLLVPTCSGTFTGLPRYIIVLFPLFILFSGIRSRTILVCLFVCSFIMQIILFFYFSRGYFVA